MSDHGHGKPVYLQSENRVFEYSVDNGATWLLCISKLRDDHVRQVQADLSARYGFPVPVREKCQGWRLSALRQGKNEAR